VSEPRLKTAEVVAIVNTNDDLVNVLQEALRDEGVNVVTAHVRDIKAGRQNFRTFLKAHDPAVVIYDIAVPYEDNWVFFQTLRDVPEARTREFVITTVNLKVLEKRVGSTGAIEIQGGRADDLEPVIDAVKEPLKRGRSTRVNGQN